MLIDRKHGPWAALTVVLTATAGVVYAANFHPEWLPFQIRLPAWFGEVPPRRGSFGGSPYGLTLGIIAAAIFVFAALLGVRRRRPTLKIGRMQTWLRAHIWFSLLTIPLVVLHSGFSVGGSMTKALLWLYAVVMGSGVFGLLVQQVVPRLMKERVPLETIFEQIPHIRAQLLAKALGLREALVPGPPPAVAEATPPAAAPAPALDEANERLASFLDEQVLPYLAARRGQRLPLGDQRVADDAFGVLKVTVATEWHPQIEDLHRWCNERRQLDLQTRLHHWLHGWLFLHVPATLVLLALVAWHALITLVYY